MSAMHPSKHVGAHQAHGHEARQTQYGSLLVMTLLSLVSMYVLMYAMVDKYSNVFASVNQFYMAGLMTMPMIVIELAMMSSMYRNKKLNALLLGLCAIAGLAFWTLIRQQTAITDRQFLRSMIPHHGGAVLMCEQARLSDPELKELCAKIISSQQSEIEFMKSKLNQ